MMGEHCWEKLLNIQYNEYQCIGDLLMPVYNVEMFLRECLDSVINQTLKDIEVICVNDGSTDGSLAILEEYAKYDNRIRIITKPNSGYGHSMNVGLDAAKGDYIGIVETDDLILPKMYETLYKIAVQLNLDIIKADYYNFHGDGDSRITKYIEVAGKAPKYYGKVLNPYEDVTPLYFTMNTWSGIYKRMKRQEHHIKIVVFGFKH
jgi:glycosyltransferase involved in cell wall biosynthesis